ncbi:MAG: trypsin-like serine protease [Thermoleophilia bacterium]
MRRTGRPALIAIGALLAVVPMASATYGGHVVGRSTAMSLAYYTVAENGLISECSGAMVARTKILTAAHCVRPEVRGRRVAVVGRPARIGNPGPGSRTARIIRVAVHPKYRPLVPQAGFDLAVLTLNRPVGSPIEVAEPKDEAALDRVGATAVFSGFGVTPSDQGWRPRPARAVSLEVLPPYNCVLPSRIRGFARNQLCAASPGRGICSGDSGGPLTVRIDGHRRLVGVATLALEEVPCRSVVGMFTRVTAVRQWVQRQVGRAR